MREEGVKAGKRLAKWDQRRAKIEAKRKSDAEANDAACAIADCDD